MTHVDLMNAVLALRFRHPGWPAVLAEGGYLVHGVGVRFRLQDGTLIAPDVLASSEERSAALLIEVKGGRNVDLDQMGRLQRVTAADLRDFAHVPIHAADHQVAVVCVCDQAHFEAIAEAVGDYAVTVLGFDGERFTIGGRALPDDNLASRIETLRIPPRTPPPLLVPYDQNSPLAEVARAVLPEVVASLRRGSGVVTPDGLLQKTHSLVHEVMRPTGSGAELDQVRRRVVDVLSEAAREELKDWLERAPNSVWRLRRALSVEQAAQTRELQSLQRAAATLIARVGGGPGGQELLFPIDPEA